MVFKLTTAINFLPSFELKANVIYDCFKKSTYPQFQPKTMWVSGDIVQPFSFRFLKHIQIKFIGKNPIMEVENLKKLNIM